jgi:uncharacterized protein (DUF433 family)
MRVRRAAPAPVEGTMQLEEYFDFLSPEDIRIRGTRVGIESVLLAYLRGASPEEIRERFPSVTLEQIRATIDYYLANKQQVQAYLDDYVAYCDRARRVFHDNPPPHVRRLLASRERARRDDPVAVP